MTGTSCHDEQMPDAVEIVLALIQVQERRSQGVTQASCYHPRQAFRGHSADLNQVNEVPEPDDW